MKGEEMCYGKRKIRVCKRKNTGAASVANLLRGGKSGGQSLLEAIGTEQEAAETERYLNELKADIMPIDQLIGFAGSEAGIQYFGEAAAKGIVSHAEEIKANGARYCDCPACAAAEAILKKLEIL